MLLVVDTNVVFSALHSKGTPLEVFEANKAIGMFEFVTPEYLFFEIGKRMDKLLSKSKLTKEEVSEIFSFIKEEMEPASMETFKDKLDEAERLAPHSKDITFLALALKLDCSILSGDEGLRRQSRVKILSPSEALSLIYMEGLPGA